MVDTYLMFNICLPILLLIPSYWLKIFFLLEPICFEISVSHEKKFLNCIIHIQKGELFSFLPYTSAYICPPFCAMPSEEEGRIPPCVMNPSCSAWSSSPSPVTVSELCAVYWPSALKIPGGPVKIQFTRPNPLGFWQQSGELPTNLHF